jgi:FG-GAP repeat.
MDDLVVVPIGSDRAELHHGASPTSSTTRDIAGGGSWVDTDGAASLPTRNADDQWGMTGAVEDIDGDGDGDLIIAAPLSSGFGMAAIFESYWVP